MTSRSRGRGRSTEVTLDDAARTVGHHIDGVGEEHRFAQIMRHQHHGHAARGLNVAQHAPQLLAREGVERAEGLVEHQDLGLVDQRAADRRALLHAAGQLPGEFFGEATEADLFEQSLAFGAIFGLVGTQAASVRLDDFERQHHIVDGGAPGQQI